MITSATLQKRQEFISFIECELAPETAVQAVIAVGSVASGLARQDSDIDAIVYLDPFDPYIVPAEFVWHPSDRIFHGIFDDVPEAEQWIQFDFERFDLAQWADPTFEWPECRCAELREGWLAFDRSGQVAELVAARTAYPGALRTARLDEAITMLDQLLTAEKAQIRWDSLDPVIAHDRLQAAYDYLVQALFAYNRCWRPWRSREMSSLLALPWLPEGFADRLPGAMLAASLDRAGYVSRVACLQGLFQDLIDRLVRGDEYGEDVIGEAFIRSHDEPGRSWNMEEWNRVHAQRRK